MTTKKRRVNKELGATLVEYAIIVVLVSIVAINPIKAMATGMKVKLCHSAWGVSGVNNTYTYDYEVDECVTTPPTCDFCS